MRTAAASPARHGTRGRPGIVKNRAAIYLRVSKAKGTRRTSAQASTALSRRAASSSSPSTREKASAAKARPVFDRKIRDAHVRGAEPQ